MKKNSVLSVICTTVFLIGIIAVLLSNRNPGSMTPAWILLAVSLVYLLCGWYLFRGYNPEGHPLLLFFTGYIYASVFMAFTFKSAGWPLAGTMLYLAPVWAVTQLVITVMIRKKILKEGLIQFLTEGGIMLILTIVALFRS
jgi:predicted neutral ceramidase superfamily lipid hydrolase